MERWAEREKWAGTRQLGLSGVQLESGEPAERGRGGGHSLTLDIHHVVQQYYKNMKAINE